MGRYFFGKWLRILKICFLYPYRYRGSFILSYLPKNITIGLSIIIEEDVEFSNKLNEIGKGSYIGSRTVFGNCSKVGSYCSIAKSVKIGMSNHPMNFVSTSPRFYLSKYGKVKKDLYNHNTIKGVIIEDDVLISSNAVIMEGLRIGQGAVIGAGAIVNKDVNPYSVVVGVPAKVIRYRFSPEKIKELLKLDFNNDNMILNYLNSSN